MIVLLLQGLLLVKSVDEVRGRCLQVQTHPLHEPNEKEVPKRKSRAKKKVRIGYDMKSLIVEFMSVGER